MHCTRKRGPSQEATKRASVARILTHDATTLSSGGSAIGHGLTDQQTTASPQRNLPCGQSTDGQSLRIGRTDTGDAKNSPNSGPCASGLTLCAVRLAQRTSSISTGLASVGSLSVLNSWQGKLQTIAGDSSNRLISQAKTPANW